MKTIKYFFAITLIALMTFSCNHKSGRRVPSKDSSKTQLKTIPHKEEVKESEPEITLPENTEPKIEEAVVLSEDEMELKKRFEQLQNSYEDFLAKNTERREGDSEFIWEDASGSGINLITSSYERISIYHYSSGKDLELGKPDNSIVLILSYSENKRPQIELKEGEEETDLGVELDLATFKKVEAVFSEKLNTANKQAKLNKARILEKILSEN